MYTKYGEKKGDNDPRVALPADSGGETIAPPVVRPISPLVSLPPEAPASEARQAPVTVAAGRFLPLVLGGWDGQILFMAA